MVSVAALPLVVAVVVAALIHPEVQAAPDSHRIPALPGWYGKLPSDMYAGFISAGSDHVDGKAYEQHEHYFFAESEGDPRTDPVLVWTNGGPGASSFFGFFVELGTFYLSDASGTTEAYNRTGIPTLFLNPSRWTQHASVLILNSPPPVGFSYCDPAGPSGTGESCGPWNDTRTATTNHVFLKNWLQAFPEFRQNPMYLVGESYAGVYVPTLARLMVDDPVSPFNLKGFAVGDGCTGTEVLCGSPGGTLWHVEFLYGHGQASEKMHTHVMKECPLDELINGVTSKPCEKALDALDESVGGYYSYNLYDQCWGGNIDSFLGWRWAEQRNYFSSVPKLSGALNDYPCGGYPMLLKWINTSAVKKALHVPEDAYFFSGDDAVGFNYTLTEKNLLPFYRRAALNTSLRVLVYNGDTDPGISSFRAQNWTVALGLEETEAWRPWTLDGGQKVGGYVTRYQGDFDFLTIRGSGHMVPEYQPVAALSFIERWIRNEEYPRYVKPRAP